MVIHIGSATFDATLRIWLNIRSCVLFYLKLVYFLCGHFIKTFHQGGDIQTSSPRKFLAFASGPSLEKNVCRRGGRYFTATRKLKI